MRDDPRQKLLTAIGHHQAGRLSQAEVLYRQVLAETPRCVDALHLLGVLAHQAGRHERAVELITRAAALAPGNPVIQSNLGEAHRHLNQLREAIACFERALAVQPDFPDALGNLGNALVAQGRSHEAIPLYRRALALQPNSAVNRHNLGNALRASGQFAAAADCFREAITLKPDFAEAHSSLGGALKAQGKLDDASKAFRRALALNPRLADAHNNLGNLLRERGHLTEALACFEAALTRNPRLAEAHNNVGSILTERGQLDAARAHLQQALALKPDFTEAHNNLGNVCKSQGRLDEAIACFRHALDCKPDSPEIQSNLILTLQYHPGATSASITAEQQRWEQRFAPPLATRRPHPNRRSPDRRLRVGYVSRDFRDHVVGANLLPLFRCHGHEEFEIFCYADVATPDPVTAEFRAATDQWRDITTLSDAGLADQVCADQIDILVDLGLHTARNRLVAFAHKPAPIQVSFAGYPGGTGLSAIDYHLTDPFLEPPRHPESFRCDAPFRLPDTFWCYQPRATDSIPVNLLPARTNGYVTFGCLNNFCKINDAVLQVWARVMRAVPGSRLLLLCAEGRHRQPTLAQLRRSGIAEDRVEFCPRQSRREYLELHHRIDLGLDTWPYNGHTTSLDSLWMGVPVVTRIGDTVVGRAGWSQLSNLRLTELVARTADEFVALAVALAHDPARLGQLRESLRARMQASPLMDPVRFARGIEAAYRAMWHTWCDGAGPSPITSGILRTFFDQVERRKVRSHERRHTLRRCRDRRGQPDQTAW